MLGSHPAFRLRTGSRGVRSSCIQSTETRAINVETIAGAKVAAGVCIMVSPIEHVYPFIGVDPPGNGLCGPYLSLGLVRLGPETIDPSTNGYRSDRPIARFTHTHVSGMGGAGCSPARARNGAGALGY